MVKEKQKGLDSFRNRVVEFRRIPAADISPNPKNFRVHPQNQRDAFRGLMDEVGFAGAELCYYSERNDGRLTLIDGAMRLEELPTAELPCLITDLTDAEADKLLACFDPLAAMASVDAAALAELLRAVETGNQELAAMLTELAEDNGIVPGDTAADSSPQLSEAMQYKIVIDCDSEQQQAELLAEFETRKLVHKAMIL